MTLFLEMHLLMAFALAAYLALRGLPMRFEHRARLAQWLLLLALAAPAALALVPRRHLPAIDVSRVFRVAPEDADARALRASLPVLAAGARPSLPAPADGRAPLDPRRLAPLALWLAALASAFALARTARDLARLRRLLAASVEIRRVGRVSVLVSDSVAVPFSTRAAGSAHVVVPGGMLARPRDFRIAIRHELQHHRQGDTLWALFHEAVACVFFLNPCVHRWRKEIVELQELSCDAALLGRKSVTSRDYGSCLLRVAETALGARRMYTGTVCMAAGPRNPEQFTSFLKRRIEMMVQKDSRRSRAWLAVLGGTLASIATIALAYGSQQAMRGPDGEEPNPGTVVVDPRIQAIAEKAVARAVERFRARSGFAVVAEPDTGRVLAVAGVDSTDPARSRFWPLSARVEPASITKGIVAAAAVDRGVTTVEEKHDCGNNNYRLGEHVYHDHRPFDQLSTAETVVQSSNICGIKIGERLGAGGLATALADFGFGPRGTAAEFPQARTGHVPAPESMPWAVYVPMVATGYGDFVASPLEILMAYGAIANGGNLLKPQGANATGPVVIRRVLSAETSRQMRQVLADVVTRGTAESISGGPIPIAGKTATAYDSSVPEHEKLGGQASVASFVGFAPVSAPRIAVYVGINHPTDSRTPLGGRHAAPVVREIIEEALR